MRDTIDMAREAGFNFDGMLYTVRGHHAQLAHLEALVRADERDEILRMSGSQWFKSQARYDEAIRERGETK